jgi:hypothetical protein
VLVPVCLGIVLGVCAGLSSQSSVLRVERHGDQLRLSAPGFHFLEGTPLERLLNGASVTYVLSVTVTPQQDGTAPVRVERRVVVSYDVWEERFSVVQRDAPGRSASHLTAAMAEAWCLDNMRVPIPRTGPEKTFVLKLECSIPGEEAPQDEAASGLTLAGLVDLLSRRPRAAPPRWEASSGPLRLADLKDKTRQ